MIRYTLVLRGACANTCARISPMWASGFAEEARAMHEGEAEARPIWGEASPEEARALADEGAPIAPLPAPFAPTPPRKLN